LLGRVLSLRRAACDVVSGMRLVRTCQADFAGAFGRAYP
jgi:hypothetical protein